MGEECSTEQVGRKESSIPAALSLSVDTVPSWSLGIRAEDDDSCAGVGSSSVDEAFQCESSVRS